MADLDFKNRNEFRKGARLRTINEDPTYLSFVLLFHYHDHHDVRDYHDWYDCHDWHD